MMTMIHKSLLDREWVEMMNEAREIGLSIEEVRLFLVEKQKKQMKRN
ncbi:anti-repressor SinI family protein [Aquibacillus saliphilus]|nr:anti-repressor SinI family protein [Aquibacillus saliphilus]